MINCMPALLLQFVDVEEVLDDLVDLLLTLLVYLVGLISNTMPDVHWVLHFDGLIDDILDFFGDEVLEGEGLSAGQCTK